MDAYPGADSEAKNFKPWIIDGFAARDMTLRCLGLWVDKLNTDLTS
jgi:hypothetical protein